MRNRSPRDDDDAELRWKLRELTHQRRRFGYHPFQIRLRREGVVINRNKTQRLYREEKLWRSDEDGTDVVRSVIGNRRLCWRCLTSAGASPLFTMRWGVAPVPGARYRR